MESECLSSSDFKRGPSVLFLFSVKGVTSFSAGMMIVNQ
ncbi:hypothetical protein C2W63_01692 [Bacillus velezensis]|nr:hypothetical protein C2W63_01692 [Bacillus velezensis]